MCVCFFFFFLLQSFVFTWLSPHVIMTVLRQASCFCSPGLESDFLFFLFFLLLFPFWLFSPGVGDSFMIYDHLESPPSLAFRLCVAPRFPFPRACFNSIT